MPEGSSSAAPVIRPGPRFEKNRQTRLRCRGEGSLCCRVGGGGLGGDGFVTLDLTVPYVNHAMGMQGDVVFVGDENDRVAFVVQALEERHDLIAGGSVEVA